MQTNEKISTSTLEFDVKVKVFNKEKGILVDAIAAGSKLTKADSGRIVGPYEDWIIIEINPCVNPCDCGCDNPCPDPNNGDCPKIKISSITKMT